MRTPAHPRLAIRNAQLRQLSRRIFELQVIRDTFPGLPSLAELDAIETLNDRLRVAFETFEATWPASD